MAHVERVRYTPEKPKKGGRRPGAGRKKGTTNRLQRVAVEEARKSGKLPHEIALDWARRDVGEVVAGEHALTIDDIKWAITSSMPYFGSKMPQQQLQGVGPSIVNINVDPRELSQMSNEELLKFEAHLTRLQRGSDKHEQGQGNSNRYAEIIGA